MANSVKQDLQGKYLLFRKKYMGDNYPERGQRIGRATGGFGCSPHTAGTAIFVDWAFGGKSRMEGYMVEAIVSVEDFIEASEKFARPICPKCGGKGHLEKRIDKDGKKVTAISPCWHCGQLGVI